MCFQQSQRKPILNFSPQKGKPNIIIKNCTAPAAPNYPSIERLIQWLIGPSPSLSATTDRPTVTGPDSKGVWTRSYLFS
jgi:hypothetical protein